MTEDLYVVKGSGSREKFSDEKVLRTIRRIGVPQELEQKALSTVKESLTPDIPTSEVYKKINEFLKTQDLGVASIKLNLKKALFELGPTGYPFEKYVGKIFETQGYVAEVGTTLQGECVTHEIDVLLEKDGKREIVEAKFHNQPGSRTDVQAALYTYARYLDVKDKNDISGVWIFTNTKLTLDAVHYAKCKGMHAVGWNYPQDNSLQDFVEKPNLYPVTILKALESHTRNRLVENGIVLVNDFLETPKEMLEDKFLMQPRELEESRKEARSLLGVSANLPQEQHL